MIIALDLKLYIHFNIMFVVIAMLKMMIQDAAMWEVLATQKQDAVVHFI